MVVSVIILSGNIIHKSSIIIILFQFVPFLVYWQTCMPIRTTAIHIVNNNWSFDMAWQVFKPFLNERMRKQVFIHGTDMTSLHEHIDKGHLPTKYGGDMPEFPYTSWMKTLAKNAKVQEELQTLGYQFDEDEFSAFI